MVSREGDGRLSQFGPIPEEAGTHEGFKVFQVKGAIGSSYIKFIGRREEVNKDNLEASLVVDEAFDPDILIEYIVSSEKPGLRVRREIRYYADNEGKKVPSQIHISYYTRDGVWMDYSVGSPDRQTDCPSVEMYLWYPDTRAGVRPVTLAKLAYPYDSNRPNTAEVSVLKIDEVIKLQNDPELDEIDYLRIPNNYSVPFQINPTTKEVRIPYFPTERRDSVTMIDVNLGTSFTLDQFPDHEFTLSLDGKFHLHDKKGTDAIKEVIFPSVVDTTELYKLALDDVNWPTLLDACPMTVSFEQ